jgi:hypothetical protein
LNNRWDSIGVLQSPVNASQNLVSPSQNLVNPSQNLVNPNYQQPQQVATKIQQLTEQGLQAKREL